MKSEWKKNKGIFTGMFFVLVLLMIQIPTICFGFEIVIDVAPATLNIQSDGEVVTVHTNIAYGDLDVSSVYLNGIAINSWKVDNRGNFVAKFLMEDVKTLPKLIIDGYNILKIAGLTKENIEFWGELEIRVIDIIPKASL
jgi:hypothetical protein